MGIFVASSAGFGLYIIGIAEKTAIKNLPVLKSVHHSMGGIYHKPILKGNKAIGHETFIKNATTYINYYILYEKMVFNIVIECEYLKNLIDNEKCNEKDIKMLFEKIQNKIIKIENCLILL